MITIDLRNEAALSALDGLASRLETLRPALEEIGEEVAHSTMERFRTSTAPDGSAWVANSPVTVAGYLGVFGNSYKKDGSLSKKGQARSSAKKPLIGESKDLSTTIAWQLAGPTKVTVGSAKPYAAMQQFGGKRSQWPHLWGDIPARPFLGLSDADRSSILDIVSGYLAS